ncbi:hypothetical protein EYF80_024394 [Liparis tanakae]|uniref:Uncharacterized protein n=1 Tax=Liparis tanakae TaxID=230148 RepID=A0A4Z2HHN9_9TELE|nr:hypothetical protein EYF80_024394 [Liparis tanakae]
MADTPIAARVPGSESFLNLIFFLKAMKSMRRRMMTKARTPMPMISPGPTNTADPRSFTRTSGGQAAAHGPVEAGLADAGIRVEHAAQLHLAQPGDLGVAAPLVLQRQLVAVQHQRAQASLEAVLGSRRGLRSPAVVPLARRRRSHLGPEKKGRIRSQRPEADGGPGRPPPLHVAVVQRQEGVVPRQLQHDSVPEAVVYRSAGYTHDAEGVVAVQLEPESTAFNLWKEKEYPVKCGTTTAAGQGPPVRRGPHKSHAAVADTQGHAKCASASAARSPGQAQVSVALNLGATQLTLSVLYVTGASPSIASLSSHTRSPHSRPPEHASLTAAAPARTPRTRPLAAASSSFADNSSRE